MTSRTPAWLLWTQTQTLLACFARMHTPVRFVGGCVRDSILERESDDIDLVTPALPQTVQAELEAQGVQVIPTGVAHGTITAVIDERSFEITTLRRDVACDGRHAEVAFTDSWEEDAQRRDFTCNALYMDAAGAVYDYTGGIDDLHAGKIRFIGDATQRIAEDALRMLRFFRFYAWYGVEPADAQALQACAAECRRVRQLSAERVQHEMRRLFAAPACAQALRLMTETGVLREVVGKDIPMSLESRMQRLQALEAQHGWTVDWRLRLAVMLSLLPDAQQALHDVAERWKLSRRDAGALRSWMVPLPDAHMYRTRAAQKQAMYQLGREVYIPRVRLAWALEQVAEDAATADNAWHENALQFACTWDVPRFPLSGNDVLALGQARGPQLGALLREAEHYWQQRDYAPTKDEMLAYLRTRLHAAGPPDDNDKENTPHDGE